MNSAILYHSKTGHTKLAAEMIVTGLQSIPGMQAMAFPVEEIDEEWARESRCLIVGTPIYLASVSGTIKTWLEGPFRKCEPAGKIGGAFATADYIHGGAELGIRTILDHMMVLGMLAYSGGGSYGKPVIHLGPVAVSGHLEESRDTFILYGKRMAMKTLELFGDSHP